MGALALGAALVLPGCGSSCTLVGGAWSVKLVDAQTKQPICDAEYLLARNGYYVGRRAMNPALCSVGGTDPGTFEIVFAKPGYVTQKVSLEIEDDGCRVTTNEPLTVFLERVQ